MAAYITFILHTYYIQWKHVYCGLTIIKVSCKRSTINCTKRIISPVTNLHVTNYKTEADATSLNIFSCKITINDTELHP